MVLALAGQSTAAISYDQNVTPDVIFGSGGNSNGYFTVERFTVAENNGVELGLRAKIPYTGILHSNGNGTYSYSLLEANPKWNFDWTVNTDRFGSTGLKIDDLTYQLGVDFDPSQGTNFCTFDPITPTTTTPFYDHSIGTNNTVGNTGSEATDAASYATLIAENNVLQQSWRHVWFTDLTHTYDPTIAGTYDIFLSASDSSGEEVARTSIQVIIGSGGAVVPEPASIIIWGLLGAGCTGGAMASRRRRRAQRTTAQWSDETRHDIHNIIDQGRTSI